MDLLRNIAGISLFFFYHLLNQIRLVSFPLSQQYYYLNLKFDLKSIHDFYLNCYCHLSHVASCCTYFYLEKQTVY